MKQFSHHPPEVNFQKPTAEQIATAAYHIYMENGCQDGHDVDDWLHAEDLLTQKLKAVSKVQAFDSNPEIVSQPTRIHPAATRQHPLARDERGSASREEIRQKNTPNRPAARQVQWRTERSQQAKRTT